VPDPKAPNEGDDMSRHVIVRIADETPVENDRCSARIVEVIHGGFNTAREAEQAIGDLVHQGDDPDTLIPWHSPNLGYDPIVGTWKTFVHR
jgi:hypothetical protein